MRFVQLSVLVPVYNVAPLVAQLLHSLRRQCFHAWECVLVDDGSTDGSGDVLDEAVRAEKRFLTVHQRNGGVSRARNRAIERATGDYVCFVDGDDLLAEAWLGEFARMAKETHADIVQLRKTDWPEGKPKPKPLPSSNRAPTLFANSCFAQRYCTLFHFYLDEAWPFLYCIRRTLLDKHHRFPPDVSINEDTVFILRLLPRLQTIAHGDYAGYLYRLRQGSALRSRRKSNALIRILEALEALWKEVATLSLPPNRRRELENHLSTFCWGHFLDWARDASCADREERRAIQKAMGTLTLAPFWHFGPVCKKYLFLNLLPFMLFRRFSLLGPQVLFAKGVAFTRPLRRKKVRHLPLFP